MRRLSERLRCMPRSPVFTNAPVLVVEDNRLVAAALDVWLNEMGYGDVRTVSTVQEAVEAARITGPTGRPDGPSPARHRRRRRCRQADPRDIEAEVPSYFPDRGHEFGCRDPTRPPSGYLKKPSLRRLYGRP
jgi:CheY-like chemotaxis protein